MKRNNENEILSKIFSWETNFTHPRDKNKMKISISVKYENYGKLREVLFSKKKRFISYNEN